MSRDLTPRETYLVSTKLDPSYFMLNVKVQYGPGSEERDLYTEQEKKRIRSYPILGRSAPDLILSFLEKEDSNYVTACALLYKVETHLDQIAKGELDKVDPVIENWFDGKLDRAFYYSEENNRLMEEYLSKEIKFIKGIETVNDWYCEVYFTDELGKEIPRSLTFHEVYEGLKNKIDIYQMLGPAADSLIRERIFKELSVRQGVEYDTIYDLWLDSYKEDVEIEPTTIDQELEKKEKATNIQWGIVLEPGERYEDVVESLGLPKEIELPADVNTNVDIRDYISAKTGVCPVDYDIEKIISKDRDR